MPAPIDTSAPPRQETPQERDQRVRDELRDVIDRTGANVPQENPNAPPSRSALSQKNPDEGIPLEMIPPDERHKGGAQQQPTGPSEDDLRRQATRAREDALAAEVENRILNLERGGLTNAQKSQLGSALQAFESSGRTEKDYYQVISQIVGIGEGRPSANTTGGSSPQTEASDVAAPGFGATVVVSDTPKESPDPFFNPLVKREISSDLSEITKILKPEEPKKTPLQVKDSNGTGPAVVGTGFGQAKPTGVWDVPGKISPPSIQDKIKQWVSRVAKLIKTGNSDRDPAATENLSVGSEHPKLHSVTDQLITEGAARPVGLLDQDTISTPTPRKKIPWTAISALVLAVAVGISYAQKRRHSKKTST